MALERETSHYVNKPEKGLADISVHWVLVYDWYSRLRIQSNSCSDGLEIAQGSVAKLLSAGGEASSLEGIRNTMHKAGAGIADAVVLDEFLSYKRCSARILDQTRQQGVNLVLGER